jgi:hypothetical protein
MTTTTVTTVTTTISEQSRPSSSSRQSRSMSIESSTTAQAKSQTQTQAHAVHVHKKRKTGYSSKSSKTQSKTDYPADCSNSADSDKRSKFTPCDHEGPCGPTCTCVIDQVHCEKACACPAVFPLSVVVLMTGLSQTMERMLV